MSAETLEFQVEARQLLQLMIHSVYSNKDVFLRELISNASDALDKLRLEVLRNNSIAADPSDLHIEIETDSAARTLTVRDNGIGMSHDEVVELIGTIANSGTASFLQDLREAQDTVATEGLIGRFGVGFYASFMVADEVTLLTRRAGESQGTRWTSTGECTYTIESADAVPQGTEITLRLKPVDTEDRLYDYTAHRKIKEIVKRYSDFITWPIRLIPDAADHAGEGQGGTDGPPPAPETINSMKALWSRTRDEVSDDDYHELYKRISHDWADPLETISMQAEGTFEYQALLFIPSHASRDLFTPTHRRGMHLYVKRVFIMDDCSSLLPRYLRFVNGVVDAQDLSLNVSREILQQDHQIQLIHRRLTKKVLSTIKDMMSNHPERYATLWEQFGQVLKEGLLEGENREAILSLCSFASTHSEDRLTTLPEYVERMKPGQHHIFFMTGESREAVEHSPHMEALRARGIEVLILTDAVDGMWSEVVPGFDGMLLRSVARGEAEIGTQEEKEEAKAQREQQQEEHAGLLAWMATVLDKEVKEVRLSTRLTISPACLVTDSHDATPAFMNLYRAMGQEVPHVKRILELNPVHSLVRGLSKAHSERGSAPDLEETVELLYGMTLLAEGGTVSAPSRFSLLLADRLERTLPVGDAA